MRRPTLSFTLVSLVTALLVLTVGAIGVVGSLVQSRSIGDLQARTVAATTLIIGFMMDNYVAPSRPLLEEMRGRAQRGLLDVDDPRALADYLAERLRYERNVAWLSYSDHASGRFVGAWRRDDGAIILNTSAPDIDGGRPTEVEVTPDGQRVLFQRDQPDGYDPRQRGWYQQAISAYRTVWTEPFEFNEGLKGMTAALALRDPDSDVLRGVFTADFFLDVLTRYLTEASRGRADVRNPLYAIVTRSGQVVGSVAGGGQEQAALVLDAALRSTPQNLRDLPRDQPVPFTFDVGGVTYYAQVRGFPMLSGPEWVVVAAVPRDEFLEVVYHNQRIALGLGLALLLVAIGVGAYLAHCIARPLRLIAGDLGRVAQLEFATAPSPRSFVHETIVVSDAVDRMKASLRSFGRYVPTQLVYEVLASGQEARLGGDNRRLTIYFSDIAGFTQISESMAPGDLVKHLGEYLLAMTSVIREQHGVVDKFIGDGILALFNAPRAVADHPAAACRAALRSQACLQELEPEWQQRGKPPLRSRIGLHTGDAIVGNIGTPERFDFTVMGDAVNLASRLEGLNKVYGTCILASQEVRDATGSEFEWRTLDRVAVVGRISGTLVSELLGGRGAVDPAILDARDRYERALEQYLRLDFAGAEDGFRAALEARPEDRAAVVLATRAAQLRQEPPTSGWDGVFRATSKE
jgi:adenylate cyclase